MFERGLISLPEGKTKASVDELQVSRAEIRNAFVQYKALSVSKAFPAFSPTDTLRVARTGERVRLADLSNIFVVELSDTNSVNAFIYGQTSWCRVC